MIYIKCVICGKKAAQNETVIVEDVLYCNECFERVFEDKELLNDKKVVRELDPTVCSNCNHDNGEIMLDKLSIYPICLACKSDINKRVFPDWIKAFIAVTFAVILFSFFWNLRFFKAYEYIREANTNYISGKIENASLIINKAVEEVPEASDLKAMAGFFKGVDLLMKDSCTEALVLFEKYQEQIPVDANLWYLMMQARAGSCFSKRDYNGFLEVNSELLNMDTTVAQSWAGVASAYSCLYVETKIEIYKTNTFDCMHRAELLDSSSVEIKEYLNMIEYRIYKGQVITREEFKKQYPTGWTKI